MELERGQNWFEQFRNLILAYTEKRLPDPFMRWFRDKDERGFFAGDKEKVLTILIDARFDQMTTAENALANTKTAVLAGCLKETVAPEAFPVLIPRQYFTSKEWTKSFVRALPSLQVISSRIIVQKEWKADELCSLMLHEIKTPYLGVKTTRLAIRWLYELMPILDIDMNSYEIPIDRLVYRVSCRLGLIDPDIDKYSGQGSDADIKIQTLVKSLLPGKQWIFDEPLWSTGRKPASGGHCYPRNPNCNGCIFEEICPRKLTDSDPAEIGMVISSTRPRHKGAHGSCEILMQTITPLQAEWARYIEQLKQQGIRGEEYRGRKQHNGEENILGLRKFSTKIEGYEKVMK